MQNQKKGFTLIELAVTFAVIGILLSISIPSAVSYYRTYKQIERNDTAQAIYVAVQNQLIRMDGWGILNQVDSSLKEVVGDDYKTDRLVQDIPTSSGNFYYVGSEEQKIIDLIYPGNNNNDLIAFGNYVIEFNPEPGKGIVYGVFFSELDLSSNNFSLYKTASSLAYRDNNEARRNLKVGYYCGGKDFVNPAPNPNSSGKLEAKVELKNEEELYLEVNTNNASHIGTNLNDWELDLTLTGLASGKTKYWPINQATDKTASGIYFKVVLDSLKQDLSFASQFAEFIPGENIKLSARLYQKKGGLLTSASQAYDNIGPANSLFSAIDSSNNIQIAKGRHLQNLDVNTSKYAFSSTIDTVLLQNDLDWATTQDYYMAQYGSSYQDLNFKPIVNTLLFDANKVKTVKGINTSGTVISNLPIIDNDLKQAGLFNEVYADIEGLTLKDCSLAIQGDEVTAGTLAGTVHGAISSCRAINSKITAPEVSKTVNIGGLVGFNDGGTITNSYARGNTSYADLSLQNEKGHIAGLVYQNAGTITMSYAAGTVTSNNGKAAGFAAVNSGTITKCYANAKTTGKDAAVGFVLENQAGGSINNSYALVSVAATTAYGFVSANADKTKITNCYAATKEDLQFGVDYDSSCLTLASGAEKMTGWYTATLGGTKAYKDSELGLTCDGAYPYPAIEGLPCYGDWPPIPEKSGLLPVYYEVYKTKEAHKNYFKYTFYAEDKKGKTIINTLAANTSEVIKDGYCFLLELDKNSGNLPGKTITYKDAGGNQITIPHSALQMISGNSGDIIYDLGSLGSFAGSNKVTLDSIDYRLYLLPDEIVQGEFTPVLDANRNQTITIDDYSLSYNPHFAYTINTDDSIKQAVIRTPRHFYNLARNVDYQSINYYQELDLDYQNYNQGYNPYATNFNQQQSVANFSGTYYGNKHLIKNSPIGNQTPDGLFNIITGTVQDLTWSFTSSNSLENLDSNAFLINDNKGTMQNLTLELKAKITVSNTGNGIQGLMVNKNQKDIINCQINLNDDLSFGKSGSMIGLLAGENDGSIKNSFVKIIHSGVNLSVTADCFGGFCGTNRGLLEHCYFQTDGATIKGNATTKLGGFVGENSGKSTDGKGIKGCYVWDTSGYSLYLESNTINAGFIVANLGMIEDSRVVGASIYSKDGVAVGFVNDNTGTINRSYTNSIVRGKIAAGFARHNYEENGRVGSINFCYSLISVEGTGEVFGFAGGNKGGSISSCYTAAPSKKGMIPFCNSGGTTTDCYYLRSAKANTTSSGIVGTGLNYGALKTAFAEGTWHLSSSGNAQPYDDSLKLKDYPFPSLTSPLLEGTSVTNNINHYGDWNQALPSSIGLYYYEIYDDDNDSMGIYLSGYELSNANNTYTATLGNFNTESEIKKTGYGVYFFSEEDPFSGNFSINNKTISLSSSIGSYGYEGYSFFDCSISDIEATLPQKASSVTLAYQGYGEKYFAVDTNFAKAIEAVASGLDFTWGKNKPALIRTAEQFDNINNETKYLSNYHFEQNRNLNMQVSLNQGLGNAYDGTNQNTFRSIGSIGQETVVFNSQYDGKDYSINNLRISNSTDSTKDKQWNGLFSRLGSNGKIANLMVRGSGVTYVGHTNQTSQYIGGVVGQNQGTIENVHTGSGFDMNFACGANSSNYTFYVGGLVGKNEGVITRCGTKGNVTANAKNMNSGDLVYLGGLIGHNNNGGKNLTNLIGTLAGQLPSLSMPTDMRSNVYLNYTTGNVGLTGSNTSSLWRIGGLIGHNAGNSPIIYCYARGLVYSPVSDNKMGQLLGNNYTKCWFCYSYNGGVLNNPEPLKTFLFFAGYQEIPKNEDHVACFGYDDENKSAKAVFTSSMDTYDTFQDKRPREGKIIYYLLYTLAEVSETITFKATDNIVWPNGVWVKETIDGVTLPRLIDNNEADYN